MKADKAGRLLAYGAGLALFGWFLFVIRGGLEGWFSGDDIMNLHYYWSRGWPRLIKGTLLFWSSYLRPGGGLFYMSIYGLWGFHPLPFRIAACILLAMDFVLLAVIVRQLTESRWAALLALAVIGINPDFSAAYFETGTIYDILAYVFFWGAFAWYVRVRHAGRFPGAGQLTLLLVMFVAALDTKEISVTLPVAVALYEIVWRAPCSVDIRRLWQWIRREGRFAAIGAVFDVAYILGKRYGPESLWNVGPYRPHYSVAAYFQSLAHYLKDLIYRPVNITAWKMAGLLAIMAVLAAISRRRCLIWGLGFILAGILPLAFIDGRMGFAYLVPSVGWAVYAGGLLDWVLEAATFKRVWLRRAAEVCVLALIVFKLAPWQRDHIEMHARAAHDMQARLRKPFVSYQDQIRALMPAPRKGARILLLADADGVDGWGVYTLIRLAYGESIAGTRADDDLAGAPCAG